MMQPDDVEAALAEIASELLGVGTFDVRGSDDLDWHNVGVVAVGDALRAAFAFGVPQGRETA